MKKRIEIIALCLFILLIGISCSQNEEKGFIDTSSTTLYDNLPKGCDSVKIVSPLNSELRYLTDIKSKDGVTADAAIFYYSENKIAVKSVGEKTVARLIYPNNSLSKELLIQEINTRSGVSYVFSVSDQIILEVNNGEIKTRSYFQCVDDVSDNMCDGTNGLTSKLLCKACSTCALAAAAVACMF